MLKGMQMIQHAECSPSRLERIIPCPGSVTLIRTIEKQIGRSLNKPNEYAEHGTMLHNVTAKQILKDPFAKEIYGALELDDKVLVDDALDYLSLIRKKSKLEDQLLAIERRVSLKSWGIPEVWGTCDLSLTNYEKQHLDVLDWKFGSGVYVSALRNVQEYAYAAGTALWPTPIKTITQHIAQPAIDNYSTYSYTIDELYEWVHDVLAPAIRKAQSPVPVLNPGNEQCLWCEVLSYCGAHKKWVRDSATEAFQIFNALNVSSSLDEAVKFLEEAPNIASFITKIYTYLQAELMSGREVPGMKLVQGKANRKWKDEAAAVKWMAKNASIDEMFESKLISPSKAEKFDRRLKKNEDFKTLFEKPQGKVSMVPENDPRPAFEVQGAAQDVFKSFVEDPENSE